MAPGSIGARVEGVHAVVAASRAGRVRRLLIERHRVVALQELVDEAAAKGATIQVVESLAASSENPQGVAAECRPLETVSLAQAVAASSPAAMIVIDHLEDPHNLGAVARSAVAAGLRAMVVPKRRVAPLGVVAFKAAAGALEAMAIAEVASIPAAIEQLRSKGVWSVGLAAEAEHSIFGLPLLAEPVAIVVGGEGRGLARLVAERVDVVARIPMAPGIESLNASVAAALACFEVARVRGWEPGVGIGPTTSSLQEKRSTD